MIDAGGLGCFVPINLYMPPSPAPLRVHSGPARVPLRSIQRERSLTESAQAPIPG